MENTTTYKLIDHESCDLTGLYGHIQQEQETGWYRLVLRELGSHELVDMRYDTELSRLTEQLVELVHGA